MSLTIPPSFGPASATLNCHLTGASVPADVQQQCIDYCEGSINQALDLLFNHPNTAGDGGAPADPAPRDLQSHARATCSAWPQKFANNGAGVRGDMKATVRAVLMDAEARRPFNAATQPLNFGKVREPMLKQVALWRHFNAISGDTATAARRPTRRVALPTRSPASPASVAGAPTTTRRTSYQQRPQGAPSVFNFYEPDYRQPGAVTDAGLFSPEFQIIHEVTSVSAANDLYSRICSGYGGGSNNCSSGNLTTVPNDRAYFPAAQVDLIPARMTLAGGAPAPGRSDGGRGHRADRVLQHAHDGRHHVGHHRRESGLPLRHRHRHEGPADERAALLRRHQRGRHGRHRGLRPAQVERQRRKALYLMHLIAISPEYSTQR